MEHQPEGPQRALVNTPPIKSINLEPWRSEDIGELCAALAKVQAEIKSPPKNKSAKIVSKKGESSSYTYNYADLADVLSEINKVAPKHGIAHSQVIMPSRSCPGKMCIITMMMHESGQWLQSEYILPVADNNHEMGGNITYGRRYVIAPLLGLASEEDTDFKGGNPNKEEDEVAAKNRAELEARTRARFKKVSGQVDTETGEVVTPPEKEKTVKADTPDGPKPSGKTKAVKVKPVEKAAPKDDKPADSEAGTDTLLDLIQNLSEECKRPVENIVESMEATAVVLGHQKKGTLLSSYKPEYVAFICGNWPKFKTHISANFLPF